ncbi:MAG TPA: DUF3164 family protein [Bacteroidales bacterium]|nr:DUF3164 family protein [Bacteroidales bacterium]HSA43574.1 DUF3164 family protein [Bacteroidales bacterium]
MIQKIKDDHWTDESGKKVPVQYVFTGARLRERHAGTLVKEARRVNARLTKFKYLMERLCQEVYIKAMEEYRSKTDGKGNFTWFNFDRSVKVEVSISDRIDFDDLSIKAAKEKLDQFLTENLDAKQEFVKDLVIDAFSTTHGRIDAKKVFQLMKYRSKISAPLFQDALNILQEGIRKPGSRTYFRIWERDKDGKYEIIDLNFSSI